VRATENNRVEIVKAGGFKLLIDFVLKNEDETTTVEALNALCVMVENSASAAPIEQRARRTSCCCCCWW
jgi:hypothetical protein